ncbi:hypothetical protein B0A52_02840 [Exophiala mesophila]|uniref:SnoaL-like domain-containing protein n=1 Tax=Exophiala mesophila TaxID=212818 RepID=A0A438NE11_EXOME|nr:hypothetical protein B0A52_02840 [Exophiala mesophila]
MAQPDNLREITPREAVADALHRCILGFDNNDRELFESACLKDESMLVVAAGFIIQGWTSISDFMSRLFSLVTTHFITNIRVQFNDESNTAHMSAHAIAYHVRADDAFKQEDASYTAGCLYFIDLIKDDTDGLWKIKKWEIKMQWTTGDRAVLHP